MLSRTFLLFFSLTGLLFISSCSEAELVAHVTKQIPGVSTPKSKGTFKVGSPYKIAGKWYRPKESYTLVETGIASWYGPNFHGKPTANGERFDQNELTAAHRTLQLPSLVRVTNLGNGRSLVVRVNDRGPFSKGRIIDLSKKSAELLGFKKQGTAKVRVEVLGQESRAIAEAAKRGESTRGVEVAMNERPSGFAGKRTAPTEPTPLNSHSNAKLNNTELKPVERAVLDQNIQGHTVNGKFYPDAVVQNVPVTTTNIFVQAGSFSDIKRAEALSQSLSRFGRADVFSAKIKGKNFYRVRFPSDNVATADRILSSLTQAGYRDAMIVVE